MQYYIKINWELTSNCKANKNNTKVAYIFSSLNNWNQSILIKIIEITMKIGEHEWVQFLKIQTIYSTLKIASKRARHLHLHMKKVTFLHKMPALIVSLNTVDSWFLEPSLFKYFLNLLIIQNNLLFQRWLKKSTTFSTSFDDANFTISHQKGTTQIHVKLSKRNTFSEGDIRVCNIEVFFKQYFGNLILIWDIEFLSLF